MGSSKSVIAAFSEDQTSKLTGLSQGQLRYWDRSDFYSPSYAEENRRMAYSRVYSFRDIVALRVLNTLRNQYGVALQHLRDVSARLGGSDVDKWVGVELYVLNKRVIWREPGTGLPQEVAAGQYVVPVVMDHVVADTQDAIQNLIGHRPPSKSGKIEKSRYVFSNASVFAGTRIPVHQTPY